LISSDRGFLQLYVFGCLCLNYRKKILTKRLKKEYETYISDLDVGIPFVENVKNSAKDISEKGENFSVKDKASLEDRVEFMETLLQEYYIDTDFLNLLKSKKNKKGPKDRPNENQANQVDDMV